MSEALSEALKKQLIEECKRLDASYDPPVNHSIDEVRSDLKLIKSIHQKKRKTERIEKVRTDEVYAAEEREKNRERKHTRRCDEAYVAQEQKKIENAWKSVDLIQHK